MRPKSAQILGLLGVVLLGTGCSYLRYLESQHRREYFIRMEPILPGSDDYYVDPIDNSAVWSQEGVQVKVKFLDDKMLDKEFDPRYSPYTLTGADVPGFDYTPPLWTTFEVTVINRTRERVEFDPTQARLWTDAGDEFLCRQGAGLWYDRSKFYDYSYLKWGGLDGNTQYHARLDRDPIWTRSEYQREKPVRKGARYMGKVTFPPLPFEVRSVTLDAKKFILAFDRFEVGYGNPVEFVDLQFKFRVDQGVRSVTEANDR